MLKYLLASTALKIFSANRASKALYHEIGNVLGQEMMKRESINSRITRGKLLVDLCNKYGSVNEGDKLLEIGTGWIHWYPIYLRLYYNVSITMFDVLDNRLFIAMKSSFLKLVESMKTDHAHYHRIVKLLKKILATKSFGELYTLLDLQYIIDKTGDLLQFQDNSFNCVFSFHVLEHVLHGNLSKEVRDIYRILKPGGYSIQQIGIDDHLSHYDKIESPKNYLRYSDNTWKRNYENEVQYFNRFQISDWLSLFDKAGFYLLEKITENCNIESLRIDQKYKHYKKEDLACTTLTIVHRKPSRALDKNLI